MALGHRCFYQPEECIPVDDMLFLEPLCVSWANKNCRSHLTVSFLYERPPNFFCSHSGGSWKAQAGAVWGSTLLGSAACLSPLHCHSCWAHLFSDFLGDTVMQSLAFSRLPPCDICERSIQHRVYHLWKCIGTVVGMGVLRSLRSHSYVGNLTH